MPFPTPLQTAHQVPLEQCSSGAAMDDREVDKREGQKAGVQSEGEKAIQMEDFWNQNEG